MEETTEQDQAENAPNQADADEQDPESQPASDPPPGQDEEGKEHDLSADPGDIESDPSQNPPIEGLKDLKGG